MNTEFSKLIVSIDKTIELAREYKEKSLETMEFFFMANGFTTKQKQFLRKNV